jgi:hypothetical protein
MTDQGRPKQQGDFLHHAIQERETEVEALITTMEGLLDALGPDQAAYSMAKHVGATLSPAITTTLFAVALRMLATDKIRKERT